MAFYKDLRDAVCELALAEHDEMALSYLRCRMKDGLIRLSVETDDGDLVIRVRITEAGQQIIEIED